MERGAAESSAVTQCQVGIIYIYLHYCRIYTTPCSPDSCLTNVFKTMRESRHECSELQIYRILSASTASQKPHRQKHPTSHASANTYASDCDRLN
jgi:hypothetical protein